LNFVADAMLGKLARWLRIMGHDVKYSAQFNDAEIVEIAEKEKRIILTHDFTLYKYTLAKNVGSVYVEGSKEFERLSNLAKSLRMDLEVDLKKCRCPLCNAKLESVSKEDIENRVEKTTVKYYNIFWECPNCHQIYWQGGHWRKIHLTFKKAQEKLKEEGLAHK
jgi:uncharacterized protein with PIN domain